MCHHQVTALFQLLSNILELFPEDFQLKTLFCEIEKQFVQERNGNKREMLLNISRMSPSLSSCYSDPCDTSSRDFICQNGFGLWMPLAFYTDECVNMLFYLGVYHLSVVCSAVGQTCLLLSVQLSLSSTEFSGTFDFPAPLTLSRSCGFRV